MTHEPITMTQGLPMADREKLFHDNAVKFYRLEKYGSPQTIPP
jgi:predicted TIM-barrel fold metal-dependent hydrolase